MIALFALLAQLSQAAPICGVLSQFEGEISLIPENSKDFIATRLKAAIPCGAWVSVRTGWAEVHLKQGAKFRLGVDTFVQIGSEHSSASLFRGRLYVRLEPGVAPISVVTANAVAEIPKGTSILFYDAVEERTQLIAIEDSPTLANRFTEDAAIRVRPGEGTVLDFRAARVVPSTPNPLDLAGLKKLVLDLNLEKDQGEQVLLAAADRSDRKMASEIAPAPKKRRDSKHSYARFKPMPGDAKASALWMRHLVGGDRDPREFLTPLEYRGPAGKAVVVVEDHDQANHSVEKKKLIEELKKIQGGRE